MEPWRRTLRVLFVIHVITSAGFALALPFLPLYVKQIGSVTGGSVELWSGLIFALPALSMMVASPIWGWVADRYGRKIMLVRSTIAGAVILALMGAVRNVEQLALLRLAQGALTGYIAASNALVAATIPKTHAGESFGVLRTAAWVGAGVGPLLGGLLGDSVGFRTSFFVTGGLLALGGVLVVVLVDDDFKRHNVTLRRGFFAIYALILRTRSLRRVYSLSFLDSFARAIVLPLVPLYILELSHSSARVASVTGVVFGVRAIAGAIAAYFLGRVGDRVGHGRVVVLSGAIMVALYLPQPFLTASWQLLTLETLAGVAGVGIVPGIGALIRLSLPEGTSGAAYGLDSSVQSLARSVGPMVGAAMAAWVNLRAAFGLVALIYLAVVLISLPLRHVIAPREEPPAGGAGS